jgi:hypothetical protein
MENGSAKTPIKKLQEALKQLAVVKRENDQSGSSHLSRFEEKAENSTSSP